mgnify:FL=1
MIKELTKEHEEILVKNTNYYIKSALTHKVIDPAKCGPYIDWIYSLCGLAAPEKIYVSSPYAAQMEAQRLAGGKNKKPEYYKFSYYTTIWYQSWYAYYKTLQDIGVVLCPEFNKLLEYDDIGIYDCLHFDTVSIICERPKKVIRANGRLHNPNGMAIEWHDGWGLYFINGRCLPPWIWEKAAAGKITKSLFLKEKNTEIRGGIYAVMGQKKMSELFDLVVIDEADVDHFYGKEHVILYQTRDKYKEIGDVPFAWIKVQCPTTSTEYMIGVEPTETDAADALAKSFGLTKGDYKLTQAS